MAVKYFLQFEHLGGKFAGSLVRESLEVVNEMRLIGITEFVGKIGQIGIWLKHQPAADGLKTDRARQGLRRDARCLVKLPFQLPRRRKAAIGQFCHSELTFGVVKQLSGCSNLPRFKQYVQAVAN